MTRGRRLVGLLAFGAGAALLVAMILEAGPSRLAAGALRVGPAFLLVLPVSFTWFALNTWGWRLAFEDRDEDGAPRYWTLLRPYLAAEAANNVTPFLAVGGEPLKVVLLSPGVAAERSAAAVIGDNVVHALTAPLFMLGGLALGWMAFDLGKDTGLRLLAAIAAAGLAAAAAWLAAHRGLAGPLARLAARWARPGVGVSLGARAGRVDALTAAFLARGGRRFWASVALHLGGRAMGAVEAWIIASALGVPLSLAGAVFLIAIAHVGVNLVFSVVPSQLGVQEAAAYLVFAAVGLDPASGVALMLVRRVRSFIWIAVGLALAGLGAGRGR